MKIHRATYEIQGITRLLGSQPADPEIRSQYIASKIAKRASIEGDGVNKDSKGAEECAMLPEDEEKRGLTVFLRDKKGSVVLCDYVIKGFLKEAATALKHELGIANAKSKIDNLVLITPAYLTICRDGEPLDVTDYDLERPLRAMTMQGPRVSVVASECIEPQWSIRFTVNMLDNEKTPKSAALTMEAIEEMLSYGEFKGLGQWRNGQNGRFNWRKVEDNDGISD